MGLYGMTSGQTLGQGTFTFDRIVPNRYLLDSRVNNDSVMPGRYALIEYDRPVAVVSDINNFTYEEGSKAYDIIPVKDGVIDMTDGSVDCIFICTIDSDNNNLYQYYYYNFSDSNSSITSYESPMTPNEFNKIVDAAYIAKNTADDIDSKAFDLWDSTAWIKIIDKEKSEFKYVKIADLNVLTPTFTVLTNSEEDQKIIGLINTFSSYDNTIDEDQTKPIATFNVPQIKQAENGVFNIRYPNPMDINISVDTEQLNNNQDTVSSLYTQDSKNFTFILGKYATSINHINDFIKNGNWPQQGDKPSYTVDTANDIPDGAGTIWSVIKEAYRAIQSANQAKEEADSATQAAIAAAENDYSQDLSVDWGINKTEKTYNSENNKVIAIKFAIENKPQIITSSNIDDLWGESNQNQGN